MTEQEWFGSIDTPVMLAYVAERISERKLRLFTCGCLRTTAGLPWEVDESIKYVEKGCDGLLRWHEVVSRVQKKAFQANEIILGTAVWSFRFPPLSDEPAAQAARNMIDYCTSDLAIYRLAVSAFSLTQILRDIVGNPFRPVAFSPEWRTDTAVLLARQMYESREFSAMPILADALQDSGCDSDDLLSHCRDTSQVHVRGCWVCDLVLGKA